MDKRGADGFAASEGGKDVTGAPSDAFVSSWKEKLQKWRSARGHGIGQHEFMGPDGVPPPDWQLGQGSSQPRASFGGTESHFTPVFPNQANVVKPDTANYFGPETACQHDSRSLPLMPTNPVLPAASSGDTSKNFFKGDDKDVKETVSEEVKTDSGELKLVLLKDLTNSDVGNMGRIILPKKEAEAYLPRLPERDGLLLTMNDLTLPVAWKFKYRYWPNNRSRMYILENTGTFVKSHGLEAGDSLRIYKSASSGNYVVCGKKKIRQLSPMGELRPDLNSAATDDEDCSNVPRKKKK